MIRYLQPYQVTIFGHSEKPQNRLGASRMPVIGRDVASDAPQAAARRCKRLATREPKPPKTQIFKNPNQGGEE